MSDPTAPDAPVPSGGRIQDQDLVVEMTGSYLDYAMSVIVGRALPDVRDGLKPVHRRVLYAMYDGGYRPDRGFNKCSRVVGDVMGQYHPHGDSAIYDTLVRLAQPWSLRYPLVAGQGNFGSPGNDAPAAMRYTECRLAPLAMELVRDIDEDTVDMTATYDGRGFEPTVVPARFPNLLVNGSDGIAVGMATKIPPHNLREVAAAVTFHLDHPEVTGPDLLEELITRVPGPDFPTRGLIVGRRGIDDAYRTGRGSITMRAVVEVEEHKGRTRLVVTELPYQVNPDKLASDIATAVGEGRLAGIADLADESSGRTGQRLVITLKRDAVAKVVLNNLYKHTQLQTTFGANMLALVDGVPRTLRLDEFVRYWVEHQIVVIRRRTRFRLRRRKERAHILSALLKALDRLDEVIALIRASSTTDEARTGLMALLNIDEIQATAILDMQLRRLAALERAKLLEEYVALLADMADLYELLCNPVLQRRTVARELAEIVARYGDERRTRIVRDEGEMSAEDLIPEEDVVVTITRDGYVKRTRTDAYRAQRRGGRGVQGAQLRGDDIVDHFFTTTTHHWILFFTTAGQVYRVKTYELVEAGRTAKGQHVANLLALAPDERIAQVIDLRDFQVAPYLVLATRDGYVKKTALVEYDTRLTNRGLAAISMRPDDELIAARLASAEDEILLVSRDAQALRFAADDDSLRPMGRATMGVIGMRFRGDDELLAMQVVSPVVEGESVPDHAADLLVATERGYVKRTPVPDFRVTKRGGIGVSAARITADRGRLVGALVVAESDELLAVTRNGGVIRTRVAEVRPTGRATMGVRLINLGDGDDVVAIARNVEAEQEDSA